MHAMSYLAQAALEPVHYGLIVWLVGWVASAAAFYRIGRDQPRRPRTYKIIVTALVLWPLMWVVYGLMWWTAYRRRKRRP
jgi:hypothetical protein